MTLGYKLIIVLTILASLFGLHVYDKKVAVSKAETAIELRLKTKHQTALLEAIADTQASQDEIIRQSAQTIKERNEQIKNVNHRLTIALNGLRDRPTRSEQHTSNPNTASTCTGRELSREDGEFLAREASAAEKLIQERDYYYKEYETVRIQLNELRTKGNK